jgi:hypothetical protein
MRAGMMEDTNMKEAVEIDDPFRLLEDADRQ